MYKRGSRYYLKRKLAGFGKVYKTLGTSSKARARQLEEMILELHGHGRLDFIRTWLEDELALERLAEAYQTSRLHELAEELRRDDVALREAVRGCLRAKEADVKDSTLTRYTEGLDHFERFCGSEAPVRECLTADNIREFKLSRREEKAAKATVNNDLIAVSILCTYALEKGWIDRRPKIKKFRMQVRIRYLEPDQIRVYMATVRGPFRPLFQLLLGSGIRLGEARGLRVCNLRFGEGEARALIEDAKSAEGIRAVFVPAWAAEALQDHIEREGLSGTDRLFAIPERTIQKEHKRACKLAGIREYTLHDHRHTAAVSLARAGMPLNLLAQQLGHSTIQMTMRYARFHADYGDVAPYFRRVADAYGVGESDSRGAIQGAPAEEAEAEAEA